MDGEIAYRPKAHTSPGFSFFRDTSNAFQKYLYFTYASTEHCMRRLVLTNILGQCMKYIIVVVILYLPVV